MKTLRTTGDYSMIFCQVVNVPPLRLPKRPQTFVKSASLIFLVELILSKPLPNTEHCRRMLPQLRAGCLLPSKKYSFRLRAVCLPDAWPAAQNIPDGRPVDTAQERIEPNEGLKWLQSDQLNLTNSFTVNFRKLKLSWHPSKRMKQSTLLGK